MLLLHPFWLTAVLPWAALVAYMIRRAAGVTTPVPFLQLWPAAVRPFPAASRRRAPLPWPVVLLLIALLLAILAAAGPAWANGPADVTVIVDRGISMSVRGDTSTLLDSVDRQLHAAHVHLLMLPGDSIDVDGRGWAGMAHRGGPSAVDTSARVRQAVTAALAHDTRPIVVITDAAVPVDPQVFVASPTTPLINVGIATFAVGDGPHPQAMVRVCNRSTSGPATLTITGGATPVTRTFSLSEKDEDRDVFIDLPGPLARVVTATLSAKHTSPVNDHACTFRSAGGPLRWSGVGAVPTPVKRMIDVYSRLRPARPDAASATIGNDSGGGVILVPLRPSDFASTTIFVTPHRMTADVKEWPTPADTAARFPDGWRALVRNGETPILAVSADDRRAWFNGRIEPWSNTPDFVIFFAGVFDALGDVAGEWASASIPALPKTTVSNPAFRPAAFDLPKTASDHVLEPWLAAGAAAVGASAIIAAKIRVRGCSRV